MNTYELLGFFATIAMGLAYLPPIISVIRNKTADTLAWSPLFLQLAAFAMWAIYGIRASAPSLVLASTIGMVVIGVVCAIKWQIQAAAEHEQEACR